jgi:predicted ATPase/DNA-binding SARP family transcriptional activator
VHVRLLGELEATADDGTALAIRGSKQRAVLAILALHRGEPVGADRLIDVLWGEDPPGNPANALQALIGNLRRTIGAAAITTSDAGYALAIEPEDLDVVRFERLVSDGRRHLEAGDLGSACDTLRAALGLCRDEPLVEFAYAEFAAGDRARLEELVLLAHEARAEAEVALGRHAEVVGELEALCRAHPLRERMWELLMLALYRAGRQADALRAYADARETLVDEFGLEPGPALRELESRVLNQDPSLDLAAVPNTGTRAARVGTAGNLRARLTSFIGRDHELAHLVDAMATSRFVTLIGPGGAGKTRLAVEAAAAFQALHGETECRDGAWLVELAGVRDAEGVAPALALALKAGEVTVSHGDIAASPIDTVVQHLQDRSLLLVLDNCEHVIAEAAAVTDKLLGALRDLRVIATSREALGVPGEVLLPIGGLPLAGATAVFADRARAVRPDFALDADTTPIVEDVCRRLDGLPLALELAAARLRALPLRQLATLLDDRFRVLTGGARTALPRQQTLRAVVDWSYDLLFQDERLLFVRLAVFTGGWDLADAEAVCSDARLPEVEVIDLLLRLVDKSLVVAETEGTGEARYSQLQTLWQYARERLAESDEAHELRDRHARWYLSVACAAHEGLQGATSMEWRRRLAIDLGNLRAALDWFIDQHDAHSAMLLTEGIAWYWFLRAEQVEGRRWLGDALAAEGPVPEEIRAICTVWHAYLSASVVGPSAVLADAQAAVDVLRSSPDVARRGEGLVYLAELLERNGQLELGAEVLAEARVALREGGSAWGLAGHDLMLAGNLAVQGQLDAAEVAARASIAAYEELGEASLIMEAAGLLAGITEARGDLEAAAYAYEALLEEGGTTGLPNYLPLWFARLGGIRARQGDDAAAEQLFGESIAVSSKPLMTGAALIGRAGAARRLGDLDAPRAWLDEALAIYEQTDHNGGRASVYVALCWWALGGGDVDAAAGFAGQAREWAARGADAHAQPAADAAAAAVAAVRTGAPADVARFDATCRARAGTAGVGRFVAILGGAIGSSLDEPDVAALSAKLGVGGVP